MGNYCYLKHKWQFVEWFTNRYPNYPKWKWERMNKNNLAGKYKQTMERGFIMKTILILLCFSLIGCANTPIRKTNTNSL